MPGSRCEPVESVALVLGGQGLGQTLCALIGCGALREVGKALEELPPEVVSSSDNVEIYYLTSFPSTGLCLCLDPPRSQGTL